MGPRGSMTLMMPAFIAPDAGEEYCDMDDMASIEEKNANQPASGANQGTC